MKKAFLLLILSSFSGIAQPIQYSYDNFGNRVQRKLYVCNNCPGSQRTAASAPEEKKQAEIEAKLGLNVFPNPAQDKMVVEIKNLKESDEATMILSDEQGKILLNKKTNSAQNEVDMSSYKAGVYFIKVLAGKETLFYKVIKL